ncbi:cytochrome c oxidase assembly protein [Notoacmeibacter sp. MSK16QG-6]|uniref:cytochrome c oxidase assembly protein n=1 Tax=Notoacmeibacter sp. MSK16QG-6 TaxID=2957982 RepID=UPI00209F455F|nr:cytochrome c oxidase assembly protein [Notoacmeibacter sp. MSK16QG-6]MCP1198222.1 cytochrome c oxidase assembly protein [Notoacmeibacter sp. MSK16QG-6]
MTADPADKRKSRRNVATAGMALGLVVGMGALSFAAVPLYKIFCQVTGYGGTTQRADAGSDQIVDRKITIRFDANAPDVPWDFRPAAPVTVRLGESAVVNYTAKNLIDRPSSGQASFNVTPEMAGAYFNKIDCFCFTEQTLQPGEKVDMGITFYVDPDILDVPELADLKTITLSYTMFPLDRDSDAVASAGRTDNVTTRSIARKTTGD